MNFAKFFALAKEKGIEQSQIKLSKSSSLTIKLFHHEIDSYKVASLIISYMLIYIGNIMPQIKQNYIIGVRTKKALNNEYVWRKSNIVGGITLVITGVLLFVISLVLSGKCLILILLASVILWSVFNDFYINIYCKKNKIY